MSDSRASKTLEEFGIDPLVPRKVVCAAFGNITPKTLDRRMKKGAFPPPDKTIGGRDYWFRSTVQREQAA